MIYQLIEGTLTARVSADGIYKDVAAFQPGALIGEMAYFTGTPRTATIVADSAARLMAVDLVAMPDEGAYGDVKDAVHRHVAARMARRLERMNRLMVDAGL